MVPAVRVGKRFLSPLVGAGILLLSGCQSAPLCSPEWPSDLSDLGDDWKIARIALHVHSDASFDANGRIEDLVEAAEDTGVDVVIVTDHDSREKSVEAGFHGETLVIVGEETGTKSHVLSLGGENPVAPGLEGAALIRGIQDVGGYSLVAHPALGSEEDRESVLAGSQGLEVYSLSTDVLSASRWEIVFKALFSLWLFPDATVRSLVDRPEIGFELWDEILSTRSFAGVGAVDSHGTYGLTHQASFRAVQTHVLVRTVDEKNVLEALRSGRCHVTFESLEEVPYFLFAITDERDQMWLEGESVSWREGMQAWIRTPRASDIRLLRNGNEFRREEGEQLLAAIPGPGVYRVEVYLGGDLWIFSNAVRVESHE